MVTDVPVKATTGISFLARLLAACDTSEDPDYQGVKVDKIVTKDAMVGALLVTPSGDTYRVTVEWISEDSP